MQLIPIRKKKCGTVFLISHAPVHFGLTSTYMLYVCFYIYAGLLDMSSDSEVDYNPHYTNTGGKENAHVIGKFSHTHAYMHMPHV